MTPRWSSWFPCTKTQIAQLKDVRWIGALPGLFSLEQYASTLSSLASSSPATTSPWQLIVVPRLGQCVLAYVSSFLNDSTRFSPLDRSVIAALLPHSIAFGDIISSAFGLCELFFEGEDYPKIECRNTRFSSPPRSRPPPACPLPCMSSLATSSREQAHQRRRRW